MNDIDNLWKRTEALNSLIGECRMRIDRLETHLAKLESSDARHIVVAPNAPANGPESNGIMAIDGAPGVDAARQSVLEALSGIVLRARR